MLPEARSDVVHVDDRNRCAVLDPLSPDLELVARLALVVEGDDEARAGRVDADARVRVEAYDRDAGGREEVTERVLPALQELAGAHPGESLLVVSHGGAIRAVLMAVQPDASHGAISNGSVHSFRFADSLELIAFDDPLTDTLDQQNALEAREEGVA